MRNNNYMPMTQDERDLRDAHSEALEDNGCDLRWLAQCCCCGDDFPVTSPEDVPNVGGKDCCPKCIAAMGMAQCVGCPDVLKQSDMMRVAKGWACTSCAPRFKPFVYGRPFTDAEIDLIAAGIATERAA